MRPGTFSRMPATRFRGPCFSMATVGAAVYLSPHSADAPLLFLCIWLTIWTFGCLVLLYDLCVALCVSRRLAVRRRAFYHCVRDAIFCAEICHGDALWQQRWMGATAHPSSLPGSNRAFTNWMKSPTKLCCAALDEIDGFPRGTSKAGEPSHSAVMTTPEAVQFNGIPWTPWRSTWTKEWAERFAADISNAEKDDPRDDAYRPYRYRGRWDRRGMEQGSPAPSRARWPR